MITKIRYTNTILKISGLVAPSKSSVCPDASVTTPFVIVALAIDDGFPVDATKSYVTAPPGAVGVALTVNKVPVVVSGLVTVPFPPAALATVTSPVHPVICASETTYNLTRNM